MKRTAVGTLGRRTRRVAIMLVALSTLVGGTLLGDSAGALLLEVPTPPPPPAPGQLGGQGACTVSAPVELTNPYDAAMKVFVFEPGGSARSPFVGGKCNNAKRPVVFFSHGYGNRDWALYRVTIEHLVSTGNVVVYSQYPDGGAAPDFDFTGMYFTVEAGNLAAVAATPRIDLTRTGYVGHSFGGGMTAWNVQQGAARGWGTNATWMVALAPAASQMTGTGAIPVPAHTLAMVVEFDLDILADHRVGMQMFHALSIGYDRKQYVDVRSEVRLTGLTNTVLVADHASPQDMAERNNAHKWYGIHRNIDAIESCSLTGANCATDFTYMGRWSDDVPFTPAISTDDPRDRGPMPGALIECEMFYANPRWETCPPAEL